MIKLFNLFSKHSGTTQATEAAKNSSNMVSPNPASDHENNMDQRQATQQIIADTPLNSTSSIDDLDHIAQERSDKLFIERQERISTFNPLELDSTPANTSPLTSTERYFLAQMHGQSVQNPTVYAYWTYEYSIDFKTLMTKLLSGGYLQISDPFFEVESLTTSGLKEILKKHGLKVTGKKNELIQRIEDNVPLNQLSNDLDSTCRKYMLTPKGNEAVANLPKSITKNLELEDLCLKHIFAHQFDLAYKLVCENELKKIIPRGCGVDWNTELVNGLSSYKANLFTDFFAATIISVPATLEPYLNELRACTILGILLGSDSKKIGDLFIRIADTENIQKNELLTTLQDMQFKLLEAMQNHSFESLHS